MIDPEMTKISALCAMCVRCICACSTYDMRVNALWLYFFLSSRPHSALRAWLLAEMNFIQCLSSSGNSGHSICTFKKKKKKKISIWNHHNLGLSPLNFKGLWIF